MTLLEFYEKRRPKGYTTEWYHKWLCLALERSYRLRRNLAVEIGPRHGKSELMNVYGPAFRLDECHDEMFMCVSNSDSLAKKFSVGCRGLVDAPLADDRDSEWKLASLESLNYSYKATGVRGQMTGHGASVLVFDDLLKSGMEAKSDTVRNTVWENVCSAAINRLSPNGVVQVLQARLHQDDPLGRLLKSGMKFIRLRLPAWNTGGAAFFEDQYAGELVKFPDYEFLSARYPREKLREIAEVSGPYYFSAQYLQEPSMGDLSYFDVSKFPRYEHAKGISASWIAVDAANTETSGGSYSAFVCLGFCGDHLKVLGVKRGRWRQDMLIDELWDFYHAMSRLTGVQPMKVIVERAAAGYGLIDHLSGKMPIEPLIPKGSKEERAAAVCYVPNRGQVQLPMNGSWVRDFTEELENFPLCSNKDQVDAFVHCLSLVVRPSEFNLPDAVQLYTHESTVDDKKANLEFYKQLGQSEEVCFDMVDGPEFF